MVDVTKDIKRPIEVDMKTDVDGIFVKSIDVPDKGTFIPQHSHTYDHVSFIANGAVWLETKNDESGLFNFPVMYKAPALITIKAHVKHLFLTIEDNTRICCIHRIDRTGEVDVHEPYDLVDGAGNALTDEVRELLKVI